MPSAIQLSTGGAKPGTFVLANLVANKLTIYHNQQMSPVKVVIADSSGTETGYDSVSFPDINTCVVDFTSFVNSGAITGTWSYLVIGKGTSQIVNPPGTFSRNVMTGQNVIITDGSSLNISGYVNLTGTSSLTLQGDAQLTIT